MTNLIPIWLGVLLWFVGGSLGLMIGCLLAASRRWEDCGRCKFLLNYRLGLTGAQRAADSMAYMSDYAKGKAAREGK